MRFCREVRWGFRARPAVHRLVAMAGNADLMRESVMGADRRGFLGAGLAGVGAVLGGVTPALAQGGRRWGRRGRRRGSRCRGA